MIHQSQVKPQMEIICAGGDHVGTVEHVDGNRIKLAKHDHDPHGRQYYLPMSAVDQVEDGKLKLNIGATKAKHVMEGEPGAQR
jgi:hypothetical protein